MKLAKQVKNLCEAKKIPIKKEAKISDEMEITIHEVVSRTKQGAAVVSYKLKKDNLEDYQKEEADWELEEMDGSSNISLHKDGKIFFNVKPKHYDILINGKKVNEGDYIHDFIDLNRFEVTGEVSPVQDDEYRKGYR